MPCVGLDAVPYNPVPCRASRQSEGRHHVVERTCRNENVIFFSDLGTMVALTEKLSDGHATVPALSTNASDVWPEMMCEPRRHLTYTLRPLLTGRFSQRTSTKWNTSFRCSLWLRGRRNDMVACAEMGVVREGCTEVDGWMQVMVG